MTEDQCEECENESEFKVMLECIGNDGPQHETKDLCAECLEKHKASVIDRWTWAEWRDSA